jgi:hypothetical protein
LHHERVADSDSVNLGSNPGSPATTNADITGVSGSPASPDITEKADIQRTTGRTEVGTDLRRAENSHIWEREQHEHYVEPEWCSRRLLDVETFKEAVWDPCCGFGRIVESARERGLKPYGSDIVDRGYSRLDSVDDFLTCDGGFARPDIICNPPFDVFRAFAEHALTLADKVAMIWLTRTLPAARWLQDTPLARVWLLTPRPSMPPGHVIARGEKPGGGKQDFCWLVWDKRHTGPASIGWLHRDGIH